MSWVKDIFDPDERRWEEIYRNRFQHDKVVRSTHGVNCTGGCSWNIHVKNGVVALETQATDYPRISADVPAYEPRGCQRGISASWYLYSPLRVKYPYLRGVLMDLWREARKVHCRSGGRLGVDRERPGEAPDLPGGPRQGRAAAQFLGRGPGAHRRLHHPHREAARLRPDHRLQPHPGHVDAQLRGRIALPAAARRRQPLLLRLVLRPAQRLARGLGRADRRGRERRLVSLQVHRLDGREPGDDPHPRRPLRRRGPP